MTHKSPINYCNLDDILESVKKKIEKQLDSLKKEIENKLDKLKEKIGNKENNTYYYYYKNLDDKLKLEKQIINLINEEIDKYKFKILNLKDELKFEISKGNQIVSNNINSKEKINNLREEKKIGTIPKPQEYKIAQTSNISKYKVKGISEDKTVYIKKQLKKRVIPESNIDEENNLNQNEQKIERLDFFTSKDIQEENKEITRTFQKEALNHTDDKEEKENENIAYYLKLIANDSRRAYNSSEKLFKKMFDEFSKTLYEKKAISNLKNDEQFKKEFSSWVKKYEKTLEGKKKYEKYFKDEGILYKNENTSPYFLNLQNYIFIVNFLSLLLKLVLMILNKECHLIMKQ